jgi:hypothetical protein
VRGRRSWACWFVRIGVRDCDQHTKMMGVRQLWLTRLAWWPAWVTDPLTSVNGPLWVWDLQTEHQNPQTKIFVVPFGPCRRFVSLF